MQLSFVVWNGLRLGWPLIVSRFRKDAAQIEAEAREIAIGCTNRCVNVP